MTDLNEAELESFRRRWREEVSARNSRLAGPDVGIPENSGPSKQKSDFQSNRNAIPSATRRTEVADFSEDIEPRTYHDLPNKEDSLKLGVEGEILDRNVNTEPESALEHYEQAVEKENLGNLGESMRHYRKAFKLDGDVHEAYKKKHFPPSSFVKPKPTNVNPSNASATVPSTAHHSLQGGSSVFSSANIKQMIDEFSELRIEAAEPTIGASERLRSPLAELPEEILDQILAELALMDLGSFTRLAQVCKRLAYVVLAEETIWKRVALGDELGFPAMHYSYACDVEGMPLPARLDAVQYFEDSYLDDDGDAEPPSVAVLTPEERALAFSTLTETLLRTTYASSWRQMVRSRPRVRFNGCYISTVNYTRAGATSGTNTLTWGAPVHLVTYFRYLRFSRDGSCISLLTTAEPGDVVHHLTKANLHDHHGSFLPSSVMKDALRGRWRLSGPAAAAGHPFAHEATDAVEGDLYVETEGVVPKYLYKMHLALAHAGRSTRNNKLAWKGFWSFNKLTDDWAEFTLKNDKAFYWSRVRSYGMGWDM